MKKSGGGKLQVRMDPGAEMKKSGGGKLQVRMDPGAETVSSLLPLILHWLLHSYPSHFSFGKDV